jgi:hypothetical protein
MGENEAATTLIDEVRDFISTKWKTRRCEICDTDKWKVLPDSIAYVRLDLANEYNAGINPASFPYSVLYLQISCLNCGNLRLVDKEIFDEWRAERRKATT